MSQNSDDVWGPSEAKAKKEGKKIWRWVVLGGCMVAFIPVTAILAAIALPMYSTFKQKGKVMVVLKSLETVRPRLEDWHEAQGSFQGLGLAPEGGPIKTEDMRTGAALPDVPGLSWSLDGDGSILSIRFHWEDGVGCPSENCDGLWLLDCSDGPCTTVVDVGTDDTLGFDSLENRSY